MFVQSVLHSTGFSLTLPKVLAVAILLVAAVLPAQSKPAQPNPTESKPVQSSPSSCPTQTKPTPGERPTSQPAESKPAATEGHEHPASSSATVADQTHCPVMTTRKVSERSNTVEWNGVTIRVCCKKCASRFKREPTAYLDVAFIPQLGNMTLPKRATEQVWCPVTKNRKVAPGDPSVTYKGKKVLLFDARALKRWKKDPEKYADPKLLPQLGASKPKIGPAARASLRG